MCVGRCPWYDRLVTTTGPPALPDWLRDCPPTIVVGHGETLIWTTTQERDADELTPAWEALSGYLPGVNVVIVCGVSSVVKAPAVPQ